MATMTNPIQHRGLRAAIAALIALIAALALGAGSERIHAQADPQLIGGFPALSLSYADAQGPGQANLTPRGHDPSTGGTLIDATINQSSGSFNGGGFARQTASGSYILAFTVTDPSGESYFLSGSLARTESGNGWRGHGRWWAISDRSLTSEWHMADWPVIEPAPQPHLSTTVSFTAARGSRLSGNITLTATADGETRYSLNLSGLQPGAAYSLRLHAGTPGRPSASFTQVTSVSADALGNVHAGGLVRFRGADPIALLDIADGQHFLSIVAGDATAATGTIPALAPLG